MIADYFAKPLQGNLFKKLGNTRLGIIEEGIERYKENYKQALITFGLVDNQGIC